MLLEPTRSPELNKVFRLEPITDLIISLIVVANESENTSTILDSTHESKQLEAPEEDVSVDVETERRNHAKERSQKRTNYYTESFKITFLFYGHIFRTPFMCVYFLILKFII